MLCLELCNNVEEVKVYKDSVAMSLGLRSPDLKFQVF